MVVVGSKGYFGVWCGEETSCLKEIWIWELEETIWVEEEIRQDKIQERAKKNFEKKLSRKTKNLGGKYRHARDVEEKHYYVEWCWR